MANRAPTRFMVRHGVKHEVPDPLIDPGFVLEQELDEIPTYCEGCGKVHGPEACTYDSE